MSLCADELVSLAIAMVIFCYSFAHSLPPCFNQALNLLIFLFFCKLLVFPSSHFAYISASTQRSFVSNSHPFCISSSSVALFSDSVNQFKRCRHCNGTGCRYWLKCHETISNKLTQFFLLLRRTSSDHITSSCVGEKGEQWWYHIIFSSVLSEIPQLLTFSHFCSPNSTQ